VVGERGTKRCISSERWGETVKEKEKERERRELERGKREQKRQERTRQGQERTREGQEIWREDSGKGEINSFHTYPTPYPKYTDPLRNVN
jgi:hypothetical protein